jgi:cytochrome c biogenesis protein CcmG, thiol:disulfide interchange protein DsbE
VIARLARRPSAWTAATGALAVAGLLWIAASARPALTGLTLLPNPRQGFPAPEFTLPSREGGEFSLADQRGQVVIINLWASWCPPCRAELPALERLHVEYTGRGLVVVGINAADQDDRAAADALLRELGITFPIVFDASGQASHAYQLRSLPSTFVVGRDGIIRSVIFGGPVAAATLASLVDDLLAEAP